MALIVDCSAKRAGAKPPVVSVNGVVIPRDAITREIQHHPARTPTLAWQGAARALVVRELLLQEAARAGLKAVPKSDDKGRRETDEEALLRQLVEREILTPGPDDAACRRYYENNIARFQSANMYEASHILIAASASDNETSARARQQGESILAQLKAHPEMFAELALMHSSCPSAQQGGNLGQLTPGQTTPEFERALFCLAPGTITEAVVPSRYGFHIIRLDRKIEGRILPYEFVAERIARYLKDSVERRATAQYVARLVARAKISGIEIEGAEAHRVH